ncbi:unnamed protein product [Closterium sp. NIES-64]|nr:unnamed protein product [Closterium sp. NIES-64]
MAADWRNMVTLSVFALVFLAIVEKSPPGALAYSSFKKKLTPIPFPSPLPSATDPDPPKPWTCDVSSGSWTPSANLPLYTGLTCPYIRSGHNCQTAGRSDMSYQKLRWRPWGCKVVQLTPQRLLTLFRNKTVVVFGDSVSKDLSTSLRCMLHAASPNFSRFKLAGGATRVWGEKVSDRKTVVLTLKGGGGEGVRLGRREQATPPPESLRTSPRRYAACCMLPAPTSRDSSSQEGRRECVWGEKVLCLSSLIISSLRHLSPPSHSPISFPIRLPPWYIRIVSLFSSHLNHIGFIPDASQPPSLIISFISLSPGSRPHLTTLLTRPYLSSPHSHISHVQVEPQNIRIVSLFSSHLNDIGFIPDASQPPSAAAAAAGVGGVGANGAGAGRDIDPKIKDLLPKADIVIFQATNWWYAEDNQWFLGGRQQKITRDAAYAIGLATLRDHVARSGFKGKAVVMGVSPSHYIVPVAGMKKGKCDINTRLDWNQTKEVRRMDSRSFEMRKVQLQVLKGSRLRYVDVLPMSFWRPDGHVVTLESTIVCTGVKLV